MEKEKEKPVINWASVETLRWFYHVFYLRIHFDHIRLQEFLFCFVLVFGVFFLKIKVFVISGTIGDTRKK